MELMLLGVGGCSSFDVVQILKKARARVESCVAELSAQRADVVPAVFKACTCTSGARPGPQGRAGRPGRRPVRREVLLRIADAGGRRRDNHP